MSENTDLAGKYSNETDTQNRESGDREELLAGESFGHVTLEDTPLYVGREEMSVRGYIDTTERDGVRVGNYVGVSYPEASTAANEEEALLGAIEQLEYRHITEVTDHIDGGGYGDLGEQNLAYLATLDPIATVEHDLTAGDDEDALSRQTVDRPPHPGERMHLVEDESVLRTGLNIPEQGIYVGDMAVSGSVIPDAENPLGYLLSNPNATDGTADEGEPAIFRHTLIAGSTGKGKTHFAKNVLRQCAVPKQYPIEIPDEEREAHGNTNDTEDRFLNLFIIDPEDEYVEMEDDGDLSEEKRQELEQRGIAVGGLNDDLQVFAPVTADDRPDVGAKTFGIPFSVVEGRPQLLLASDAEDPTWNAIRKVLNGYFEDAKESNSGPKYDDYEKWLGRNGPELIDNDNILAAVKRRTTGWPYSQVFDHGTSSLEDYTAEMFRREQTTVVATGHLRGPVEKLVLLSLMTHIVENKIDTGVEYPQIKGTPLLLCVDEAHEYLADTDRPRERYLVRNFRQAAKRGRKDKFGLCMITQNPQDIDDEVLKQTNTRMYLGLQREVLDRIYVPSGFTQRLTTFGTGQVMVDAPDVQPVELRFGDCVTKHTN